MAKNSSRKHQKLYRMKGCAKKTRKNHLGGSLAYTGKPIHTFSNPNLAYTGKGGANVNASNPIYPNTGPIPTGKTVYNIPSNQHGGSCSSCSAPCMTGGQCPFCHKGFMMGGSRHRVGCKCSKCKKHSMKGGNSGIPYANGLVGNAWSPSNLPGGNGIPGDSNHYSNNTYDNDISRQMVTNPPFSNPKGGRRRKQKGGTLSNFIGQDLINLGRQFQFGLGSAYNALAGYSSPVNPMPWRDQFPNRNPALSAAF